MGIFKRSSGELSRHDYAKLVLAEVRRHGVAEAWYDSDAFAVRFRREPGATPATINLVRMYQEDAGRPADARDARVAGFVAEMVNSLSLPETWEAVAPLLRPVLRPATFGQGTGMLFRPALPYLREAVVIDQPATMAYVKTDKLAAWGVPAEQVFATARANLAGVGATPDEPPTGGPSLLRFVDDGDGYFVSRLLVDGWLAGLAGRVGGQPVAFAPDQNSLIVTAAEPGPLAPLYELAESEYREAARSVSPVGYTVDDAGRVVPYAPPPGHPAEAAAHRAEVILAATEYQAQGEYLKQLHEKEGRDLFVASLLAAGRDDDSVFSVASWADGVEALLPVADFVAFNADGVESFYVPQDAAVQAAGLTPADGLYPPRYHVHGWPPPPVIEQLKAQAVRP